jgi:hypothetical protein
MRIFVSAKKNPSGTYQRGSLLMTPIKAGLSLVGWGQHHLPYGSHVAFAVIIEKLFAVIHGVIKAIAPRADGDPFKELALTDSATIGDIGDGGEGLGLRVANDNRCSGVAHAHIVPCSALVSMEITLIIGVEKKEPPELSGGKGVRDEKKISDWGHTALQSRFIDASLTDRFTVQFPAKQPITENSHHPPKLMHVISVNSFLRVDNGIEHLHLESDSPRIMLLSPVEHRTDHGLNATEALPTGLEFIVVFPSGMQPMNPVEFDADCIDMHGQGKVRVSDMGSGVHNCPSGREPGTLLGRKGTRLYGQGNASHSGMMGSRQFQTSAHC